MEATAATLERRVRVIPATRKPEELHRDHDGKMRVAAYCRVSTDSEEQLNSYEAPKTYYTQKIQDSPDREMAGVYADEGISGTSLKKRTQFNKMITACKRGHIDLIITKSLSRFARNTVDCLDTVRLLKANGIGVYFEKENINTLTESSEFLITLFSGFAQAESESLSKNVAWGKQKSAEAGKVTFQYKKMLGYRKGADGQPEIVQEEAKQALSQAGARLLQLKKRMDAVSREQSDVLDRLLVNMADTELNARMKALTDEKESLKAQIADALQAETDQEEQAARRRQMWDSIMECAAGYTEFDNELVRQVIQKITVEDAETIRIQFRDSKTVIEQEIYE
nr:recombinase family protein [uncultured Agathobaculum sp.]